MKVVQINATCGAGSTGKICMSISQLLNDLNVENYILYSLGTSNDSQGIKYQSDRYTKRMALRSRILGNYGFNSKRSTLKLLEELDRIKPDVVHLHNLHTHNCDLKLLFSYFREKKIKLYWTFHDCWAFTGYCPHFAMVKCDNWKSCCRDCVQRRAYSWFFDRSEQLFLKKKELLLGQDLTIVTPSAGLADLVKQSFLRDYPVKVINNGIDLKVFKHTEGDFRKKYQIENKKIVLGVAFGWAKRKGLDVFVELANRLGDAYKIVLVGTDKRVEKSLPKNVISIHRTQNQQELAEIYSAADVFVNPTREENYPTVNMEALACGTPVLTFRTGGSPEMLDECCGSVVDCDDVDAMEQEVIRICTEKPYSIEQCLKKANEFDQNKRFKEYLSLYETIVTAGN